MQRLYFLHFYCTFVLGLSCYAWSATLESPPTLHRIKRNEIDGSANASMIAKDFIKLRAGGSAMEDNPTQLHSDTTDAILPHTTTTAIATAQMKKEVPVAAVVAQQHPHNDSGMVNLSTKRKQPPLPRTPLTKVVNVNGSGSGAGNGALKSKDGKATASAAFTFQLNEPSTNKLRDARFFEEVTEHENGDSVATLGDNTMHHHRPFFIELNHFKRFPNNNINNNNIRIGDECQKVARNQNNSDNNASDNSESTSINNNNNWFSNENQVNREQQQQHHRHSEQQQELQQQQSQQQQELQQQQQQSLQQPSPQQQQSSLQPQTLSQFPLGSTGMNFNPINGQQMSQQLPLPIMSPMQFWHPAVSTTATTTTAAHHTPIENFLKFANMLLYKVGMDKPQFHAAGAQLLVKPNFSANFNPNAVLSISASTNDNNNNLNTNNNINKNNNNQQLENVDGLDYLYNAIENSPSMRTGTTSLDIQPTFAVFNERSQPFNLLESALDLLMDVDSSVDADEMDDEYEMRCPLHQESGGGSNVLEEEKHTDGGANDLIKVCSCRLIKKHKKKHTK